MQIDEKSPPGWSGTVKAMKNKHKDKIDNPYALAWSMKNKGEKAHYKRLKDDDTTKKVTPEKKEKYKNEEKPKKKHKKFREWLEDREKHN